MGQNPITQSGKPYQLSTLDVEPYILEVYTLEDKPNKPILYLQNTITNNYHRATDFFSVHWDVEDIQEDLLPTIDEIIEQGWGNEVLNGQIISVIIEPEKSFFTRNNDLTQGKIDAIQNPDAHLPTPLFRAIAVQWLTFQKQCQ